MKIDKEPIHAGWLHEMALDVDTKQLTLLVQQTPTVEQFMLTIGLENINPKELHLYYIRPYRKEN